jgi:chitodextrinase
MVVAGWQTTTTQCYINPVGRGIRYSTSGTPLPAIYECAPSRARATNDGDVVTLLGAAANERAWRLGNAPGAQPEQGTITSRGGVRE